MAQVAIAVLVPAFAIVCAYLVIVRWGRGIGGAIPVATATGCTPFFLPEIPIELRNVLAAAAMVLSCRLVELVRRRVPDPRMLESLAWFALYLVVPTDLRRCDTDDTRRSARRRGLRRIARGAALVAIGLAGQGLRPVFGAVLDVRGVHELWALSMMYLGMAGGGGVLTGLAMQAGVEARELFDLPVLARSPRDLWGRRWNTFVSTFSFRHVFLPLRRRYGDARTMMLVFIGSGLAHEYVVAATLGRLQIHVGWMLAFFAVQGLGAMAQLAAARATGRKHLIPRPVAVVLHLGWLAVTAPLFLTPFDELFAVAGWNLW